MQFGITSHFIGECDGTCIGELTLVENTKKDVLTAPNTGFGRELNVWLDVTADEVRYQVVDLATYTTVIVGYAQSAGYEAGLVEKSRCFLVVTQQPARCVLPKPEGCNSLSVLGGDIFKTSFW